MPTDHDTDGKRLGEYMADLRTAGVIQESDAPAEALLLAVARLQMRQNIELAAIRASLARLEAAHADARPSGAGSDTWLPRGVCGLCGGAENHKDDCPIGDET